MTRDFAKQQLARIQAFWPSMPASTQAVDEFQRALRGFTDAEIEGGITDLIDTHLEPGAPKLGHMIAKVRARRPKTFDTATEEELQTLFAPQRQEKERQFAEELRRVEAWMAAEPERKERYEKIMADLLQGWPADGIATGRKALHPTVLRRTVAEDETERRMRIVR